MKKKRNLVITLVIAAAVAAAIFAAKPERRVERYVAKHKDTIEHSLENGLGISSSIRAKYFNTWEGEHYMTEFILFTGGDNYYGCYYSPDDVPLAFQNTEVELTQGENGYWIWHGEGDNQGETYRIEENWYYFKATF